MADSAASTQSRPSRAASKKRRQATVSTETENKLARAARSAQRLAQLSDASRDGSTLDLFPDDPTRATLEAMNIDVRQGTLHGFELPDVVLAAVGAFDLVDSVHTDAKAARRAPRAAKSDEAAPVSAQLSGLEVQPEAGAASPTGELAFAEAEPQGAAAVDEKPAAAPLTPSMAAATVARSVTALRQAGEPGASAETASSKAAGGEPPVLQQRFETTFATAATASREAAAAGAGAAAAGAASAGTTNAGATNAGATNAGATNAGATNGETTNAVAANARTSNAETAAAATKATPERTAAESGAAAAKPQPGGQPARPAPTPANVAFGAQFREAQRAEAAAAALRAAPELDRARATAFADTVDALYGVIADQRRAATDHSRRMKWLLSIVVGALLVTVAIGITQTILLMRLTRETTAQQRRIEQMMQNQQAAMASLLDTHMAMASAAVANAAAPAAAASSPAAVQQAAGPSHGKRSARAQHAHKPKAANSN
ncbi:hypothetical protein [Paraburkholderia lacunae]|uniref:Cell wall surface anchor family protein n=1 Tax=Paraburkholderia lacunae TaxID=2211104 RepID=A0A370N8P8_9BURK|nr:hypothetical protein [Paraburkholderia lacunae]RDK01990.1 hypothetical protein DLM46_13590 [Paraburkholderia lacunae]